jgi:hypothetical protein
MLQLLLRGRLCGVLLLLKYCRHHCIRCYLRLERWIPNHICERLLDGNHRIRLYPYWWRFGSNGVGGGVGGGGDGGGAVELVVVVVVVMVVLVVVMVVVMVVVVVVVMLVVVVVVAGAGGGGGGGGRRHQRQPST